MINNELIQKLECDIEKSENYSLFDLFDDYELDESKSLLLLSLLEVGNTIDGVIIANKLLKRHGQINP